MVVGMMLLGGEKWLWVVVVVVARGRCFMVVQRGSKWFTVVQSGSRWFKVVHGG